MVEDVHTNPRTVRALLEQSCPVMAQTEDDKSPDDEDVDTDVREGPEEHST